MLNIIIQDILKVIVNNDWDLTQDLDLIRSIEQEEDNVFETSSKYILFIFIYIILLTYLL